MDAALFEHSKFLRKHVKHEENVDGGIKSKHVMLRESFDGEKSRAMEAQSPSEAGSEKPRGLRKTMRSNAPSNTNSVGDPVGQTNDAFQDDPLVVPVVGATSRAEDRPDVNGMDYAEDAPHSIATDDYEDVPNANPDTAPNEVPIAGVAEMPAWQAATDNHRAYGDEASLQSAAATGAVPGLIEHHPTTMESTPVVGRPVPHSLQSNSEHARFYDAATGVDPETHLPHEDPVARY